MRNPRENFPHVCREVEAQLRDESQEGPPNAPPQWVTDSFQRVIGRVTGGDFRGPEELVTALLQCLVPPDASPGAEEVGGSAAA